MLEYSKIILTKVSFNTALFEKELVKALNILTNTEKVKILNWCKNKFSHSQQSILEKY